MDVRTYGNLTTFTIYKDVALVLLYNTSLILGTLPNFFQGTKNKSSQMHTAKQRNALMLQANFFEEFTILILQTAKKRWHKGTVS